jgi:hypothetical protein
MKRPMSGSPMPRICLMLSVAWMTPMTPGSTPLSRLGRGHLHRGTGRAGVVYQGLCQPTGRSSGLSSPSEAVTIIREALELYRRLRRGELMKA